MRDAADCVRRLAELAGVSANENRGFDWPVIENSVGLRLPADYKLLAERFPRGWFRRFVVVELPDQAPDGGMQLPGDSMAGELEDMRYSREEGIGSFPYPIFPEPGGLLPWGRMRDGGLAFWLTQPAGDPDGWPVVVSSTSSVYWGRFDGTVCEFLIEVAAGRYDAGGFTEGGLHQDESGALHLVGPSIDLGSRPAFEPLAPPAPAPVGPAPDFWLRRIKEVSWERLPVNELAAVRDLAGQPPAGVLPVDWAPVHARLGFTLPTDYREFIDTYGPGTFGDIRITAPGAPREWDLFALLERKYDQVRDLPRGEWDPPYYPEPGGTICWGETTGGHTCGWAPVRVDPDQWTVVAVAPSPALNAYGFVADASFTTVLRRHAAPRPGLEHEVLPPRDPSAGPVTFTPYTSA